MRQQKVHLLQIQFHFRLRKQKKNQMNLYVTTQTKNGIKMQKVTGMYAQTAKNWKKKWMNTNM